MSGLHCTRVASSVCRCTTVCCVPLGAPTADRPTNQRLRPVPQWTDRQGPGALPTAKKPNPWKGRSAGKIVRGGVTSHFTAATASIRGQTAMNRKNFTMLCASSTFCSSHRCSGEMTASLLSWLFGRSFPRRLPPPPSQPVMSSCSSSKPKWSGSWSGHQLFFFLFFSGNPPERIRTRTHAGREFYRTKRQKTEKEGEIKADLISA